VERADPMDEPRPEDVAAGHEFRDVNVRALVLFGLGLAVLIGVTMLGGWWLFVHYAVHQPRAKGSAGEQVEPGPYAEPKIQVNPSVDLEQLRTHEETVLHSYGWTDRQAGVARIPIERAMDLVVQRGLPLWPIKPGQPVGQQMPARRTEKAAPAGRPPGANPR